MIFCKIWTGTTDRYVHLKECSVSYSALADIDDDDLLDDDGENEPEQIVNEGCSTDTWETFLPKQREHKYETFGRLLSSLSDVAYEVTFTCDVNACQKSKKT